MAEGREYILAGVVDVGFVILHCEVSERVSLVPEQAVLNFHGVSKEGGQREGGIEGGTEESREN